MVSLSTYVFVLLLTIAFLGGFIIATIMASSKSDEKMPLPK